MMLGMMFLDRVKKILLIILLVLLGAIAIFTSYILATGNSKTKEEIKAEQETLELNLNKGIKITNINNVYNVITNYSTCGAITKEITNSSKYINIILEDVPKADTIEEYYKANKKTISVLYALTTEEEFINFYKKIQLLQEFKECEVLIDTIQNTSDEYSLKLKLIGNTDVIMPVTIHINDKDKLLCTSYWNRE